MRILKWVLKIFLPVCLILAGFAGWHYFKSNKVKIKHKQPRKHVTVVETITMTPGNYQSSIHVMGTVMPDNKIELKSRVSGEVISVFPGFVQGGVMKKGDTLLLIDDSDYKIEVIKAKSALDKALSSLAIEKGSQKIAKEELKLINEASSSAITASDLALRKPQLVQATAEVKRARADLEKARLNLSRTKVILPFNALILEKKVSPGSLVNVQGSLATIVNVDTYRIEAQVPLDRLAIIHMGEHTGSDAVIHSQYSHQSWKGKVVRKTGKISIKSRMAGVIILVPDPLGLKNRDNPTTLLLDDYVDIRISAEMLENVFSLPRALLRDDNTVWVYHAGILEIRKVGLALKQYDRVYIKSGISPGDSVITSDLPAPVNGMALQTASGDHP